MCNATVAGPKDCGARVMAVKEPWVALGLGLPLLLLAWLYRYSRQQQMIRKGAAKVPPGNFWQLPFVGESIQLLKGSPDDFMLPRISKYGSTFRTHLLGSPSICTTSVDAAKFVLQSPHLFKSSYTTAAREIFGSGSINLAQGELHVRYRRIIQGPIISGALKNFVEHIDQEARQFWAESGDQATIICHKAFLRFSLHVAMLFCCEDLKLGKEADELVELFQIMEDGFPALPINLPGTVYGKALKARAKIQKFLLQQIQRRRQEKGSVAHNDVLEEFMNSTGADGNKLTDDHVADAITFILVAGHETIANTMVWVVRYLCLHPKILERVKAENDAVARKRKHVDDPITWEETQELTLTTKVLHETLRMTTIVAFAWREATEDVVYNGMVFPKGWKVFIWFKYFHLDPEHFANPLEFSPERFETQPKLNTYTPFGNGTRVCPGRELAITEMQVFMHRLLTNYDFKAIGDLHKIRHWTLQHPQDGLPLEITKRVPGPVST